MASPLTVDYFTDVLCVWAWIAQLRVNELEVQWGEQIELRHHYLNVFGDTESRISEQWRDREGFVGFSKHVLAAAAPYIEGPLNSRIWTTVRPLTSANAHLVIKAAEVVASTAASAKLAVRIRRSFFEDAVDVGQIPLLLEIATDEKLDAMQLRESLDDGSSAAALMCDHLAAQKQNISGSPSWIMNNGRQKLYGNVSYHVLHANVEGLLEKHGEEASWC